MSLNINISGVKFAGFSSLGNTCLLFTSNKKILSLTQKNVASLERFSPFPKECEDEVTDHVFRALWPGRNSAPWEEFRVVCRQVRMGIVQPLGL